MTVDLGLIHPPVGMNVFVITSVVPGVTFSTIFRGIVPFIVTDLIRQAILAPFTRVRFKKSSRMRSIQELFRSDDHFIISEFRAGTEAEPLHHVDGIAVPILQPLKREGIVGAQRAQRRVPQQPFRSRPGRQRSNRLRPDRTDSQHRRLHLPILEQREGPKWVIRTEANERKVRPCLLWRRRRK